MVAEQGISRGEIHVFGIAPGVPDSPHKGQELNERLTTTKKMGEINGIVGHVDERADCIRNCTWSDAKMTNRCLCKANIKPQT